MSWPAHTHDFFAGLEANNSKDWYDAHKAEYKPIEEASAAFLASEAERTGGETKIFRLRKDARFSKGQPPFRTEHLAGIRRPGGAVHSYRIDATGVEVSVGIPIFEKAQVTAYRTAIAEPSNAATLHVITEDLASKGFELGDPDLKKPLCDLPDGHPHPNLSRHKSLQFTHRNEQPAWLVGEGAQNRIRTLWSMAEKLDDWLHTHVTG